MAKRRMTARQARFFGKRRSSSSRRFGGFRKVSRRSGRSSFGGGDLAVVGGAAVYGAAREWLSEKLQPITQPVAGVAGGYADEVVLGIAGYLMSKGKIPLLNKVPMSRDIGRAALIIEAARIGSGVAGGVLSKQSTTTTGVQVGAW
jgi:hypothetical protein